MRSVFVSILELGQRRTRPLEIVAVTAVVTAILYVLDPPGIWINEPLHSTIEALGAAIAIGTSVIFLKFSDALGEDEYLPALALGLLCKGILDGFHATVSVGFGFVWLHSLAVFLGGLVTLLSLFLPQSYMRSHRVLFFWAAAILLLGLGSASVVFFQHLPLMTIDGEFTLTAYAMNFLGGSGFLIAAFVIQRNTANDVHEWTQHATALLVLLGLSGLVFELSAIWDVTWWWWHVLTVVAFSTALIIVFQVVVEAAEKLKSQALVLKELNQTLSELSQRDGLTGLFNRRVFDQRLKEDVSRQQRSSGAFSLLMVDIDFFKKYNDHYGHQGGDDVLKKVARCLEQQAARSEDMVARYGGEEFVILLPGVDQTGAKEVSDRIHYALEQADIPHEKSTVASRITVSVGCFGTARLARNTTDTEILSLADKALYAAKKQGRARTCFLSEMEAAA